MKKTIILFTLILCCMAACTGSQKKEKSMMTGNETLVCLEIAWPHAPEVKKKKNL